MSDLPILSTETIWAIVNGEIPDEAVNRLVWNCLGYRYNEQTAQWDTSAVAPEWVEAYSDPPDFIGSRPATVKLTRSIPPEDKQLLKEQLGFEGYMVGELNPTLTRRATAANWLLSHMRQHQTLDESAVLKEPKQRESL
jgi:Domain of unknown function (DUF1823)